MTDFDREYFRRRAEEEFAAADEADSETATLAHRLLGERYRALVQEAGTGDGTVLEEPSLRTL